MDKLRSPSKDVTTLSRQRAFQHPQLLATTPSPLYQQDRPCYTEVPTATKAAQLQTLALQHARGVTTHTTCLMWYQNGAIIDVRNLVFWHIGVHNIKWAFTALFRRSRRVHGGFTVFHAGSFQLSASRSQTLQRSKCNIFVVLSHWSTIATARIPKDDLTFSC